MDTENPELDELSAWLVDELHDVALGDKRLNRRLLTTGAQLAARPSGSINQACADWADTKAAYRLFANAKTTAEKIRAPHYRRTRERARGHQRLFAIQDTTYLNYTHHPATKGLGPIGTAPQKLSGLVMHTALLMSEEGLPLGLASQAIWARPPKRPRRGSEARRKLPLEAKESAKWLQALQQTRAVVPPEAQLITIGDRESDLFALFEQARTLETELLVRAAQNRSVCAPEVGRLWAVMGRQKVCGQLQVLVPARQGKPGRQALVTVRFAPVRLKAPRHLRKTMGDISLYAVLVQEEAPPPDSTPLCWLLLTTVPVHNFAEAVERIRWYGLRWQIEVYHKVLKSGCCVEKAQLAHVERLLPYLALLSIIAWRLFWMTLLARHAPEAPCTLVLAAHEWRALYAFHHRTQQVPARPPTVGQVVLWIAQLGGFLARKNDGPPGVTVLWRGWQRLSDIAAAWLAFHPS
ncbi:transposase Tn5 [Rhodothermus marinus SG0.5JP17-172]|uniref:IS4 family transposase n=1 Tax=Rhodothermus marinus TaxID=29549 RepID=UPI000223DB07|nr:IS4 family transposase [Rhodothermus marinus]AEN73897.1 transposase Tn5 [Rhodothermus marinus SG0.5JP17-172]